MDRKQIIALAAKHRLPAIYQWREHAAEGGLMAYDKALGLTIPQSLLLRADQVIE